MSDDLEHPLDLDSAFTAGKRAGALIERWDGLCPYTHRKLRAAWSDGFAIARIEASDDRLRSHD